VAELFDTKEHFYLVGYSFGAFLTLELARMLEESGKKGHVVLIDGAPLFLKKLAVDQMTTSYSDEAIQLVLFSGILRNVFPDENINVLTLLKEDQSWDERLDRMLEFCKDQSVYSIDYLRKMAYALFQRIKLTLEFDLDNVTPIKSVVTLVRPNEVSVVDIDEEYGLTRYSKQSIVLKFINGNHITMLENPKLPQIINETDPAVESNKAFKKHHTLP
jgi:fatty acid synthase